MLNAGEEFEPPTFRLRVEPEAACAEDQAEDNDKIANVEGKTNQKGKPVTADQVKNISPKPRAKRHAHACAKKDESCTPANLRPRQ